MAVAAARVSVTTSATRLDAATKTNNAGTDEILVRNRGAVAVFLGGSGVATGTGFQLDPGESVSLRLLARDAADSNLDTAVNGRGDELYGIVASGTATCHVIQAGV